MRMALGKILTAILALWASRKLWMCLFSIMIMWGIYWHTAYHLTKLAADLGADKAGILLPILNDMFQVMMYGVVTIAVGYTGFSALQGFTRNSAGSVMAVAKTLVEDVKERIDQNITVTETVEQRVIERYAEKYADDPSYRPVETVPNMDEEEFR